MKFTLRDFLNAVFRHLRALTIFWVVTIVAVIIFYTQTRKLYDSTAEVLVSLGSESEGKAEFLNDKNMQVLQRDQQIRDEQQILESHEVLLTTVQWLLGDATPGYTAPIAGDRLNEAKRFITGEEPEATLLLRTVHGAARMLDSHFGKKRTHAEQVEDIASELSKDLSVNAIFNSDVLDVHFRYRDPQVAQTILQLIVAAYLDHHIAVFQSTAEENLLKAQYDSSIAQYNDQLAAFSAYMTQHGVYSDDTQVNALMEQREKLEQSLNQAEADQAATSERLASLKSIDTSLQKFERYSTTEVRNKERELLATKLNDAMLEQRELLNRHPEESRAYQEEQSKLDELGKLLSEQPMQVVDQTEQRRSKASELVESETVAVTETLQGDEARVQRLHSDVKKINAELSNYAQKLQGFDALKLQLSLAKQQSEKIAQAYVDSRLKTVTTQNAITNVSVIDGPTWDWHPATPKKKMVMVATLGLLFIGSLALLLACVELNGTVADRATAEHRVGAPVVSMFPVLREESGIADFADQFARENRQEFARMYQALRSSGSGCKVILLAESSTGEGASLVGYGLAKFLSHDVREKTAFIDHTAHSIIENSGPRDAPAGDLVLVRESTEGPVGKGADGDPVAVLSKLRQDFAYIVVASGAVKDATDLLAISGIVSATLLIVEVGKTRRAAARYSLDMLQRYGFQNVKLILNRRIFYIPEWLMRFV